MTQRRFERSKIELDQRDSYIVRRDDSNAPSIIVFIHGFTGDHQETWGSFPERLLAHTSMISYDYASFGYSTTYIDLSAPDVVQRKLLLWCTTHLPNYHSVFFITHSLGGLLVRSTLAQCVEADDPHLFKFYRKVRAVFLIASPISGAGPATLLARIPILRNLNKKAVAIAKYKTNGGLLRSYNISTIERAKERGVLQTPRFYLYEAEKDAVINVLKADDLTPDDRMRGVVPGTHTSSKEIDINSTLGKSIAQTLSEFALNRPRPPLSVQVAQVIERLPNMAAEARRDIILISCSFTKDSGGRQWDPEDRPLRWVPDSTVREGAFQTRRRLLEWIQGGLFEDRYHNQGNRGEKPHNKELRLGPDFDGDDLSGHYLHAWERYKGRGFVTSPKDWINFLANEDVDRPTILIMSGLYGIIDIREQIQNYDVHLTDWNVRNGQQLCDLWRDHMTLLIAMAIRHIRETYDSAVRILDLLSETEYQDAIEWRHLYRVADVYHRIFPGRQDIDALPDTAVLLNSIVAGGELIPNIKLGCDYKISDLLVRRTMGLRGHNQIAFERPLGSYNA